MCVLYVQLTSGCIFLFFKTTKNKNIQQLKYRNIQEVMNKVSFLFYISFFGPKVAPWVEVPRRYQ